MEIIAAYVCKLCDIEGTDAEIEPGIVNCWNCGQPAVVTARIVKAD